MASNPAVVCVNDCSTSNMPVVSFEACNPQIFTSEIQAIFIGKPSAIAFVDVTDADEWSDRISDTDTPPVGSTVLVGDLLRKLIVIGDVPAPTQTTREVSGGRTVVTKNLYVVNFEIDDVSIENWTFAQKIQCGKGSFPVKAWLVTKSLHAIGGTLGIDGKMKLDMILDRGADGIERLVGSITFEATIFPNRDNFPLTIL